MMLKIKLKWSIITTPPRDTVAESLFSRSSLRSSCFCLKATVAFSDEILSIWTWFSEVLLSFDFSLISEKELISATFFCVTLRSKLESSSSSWNVNYKD